MIAVITSTSLVVETTRYYEILKSTISIGGSLPSKWILTMPVNECVPDRVMFMEPRTAKFVIVLPD